MLIRGDTLLEPLDVLALRDAGIGRYDQQPHRGLQQAATRQRQDELAGELEAAQGAHQTAAHALTEQTAVADRAREALRAADGTADDAARQAQRAERELAETEHTVQRIAERMQKREARLREISDELEQVTQEQAETGTGLATRRQVLGELEAQQEAARERRVHWQVEEAQISAREQAAAEREAMALAALESARETIATLTRELADIERDTGGLTDQRQEWADRLAERRVAVQEMESAVGKAGTAVEEAERQVTAAERALAEARAQVEALSERAHKLDIEQTELDGRRRGLVERIEGEWHKPLDQLLADAEPVDGDTEALREEAGRLTQALEQIGPVNALAVEEHAEAQERLTFLQGQRADLVHARDRLREALREIDETARTMFADTFVRIQDNFRAVFTTLFEGGECDVRLADPDDPLGSDIDIHAAPRGKRTQRIHLLSSGERALVAISLLFAIYLTKPSPFCLLDEVDAPLDDANVTRFTRLLDEFKQDTQFIVITHNPRTMQVADAVYGVTMQEPGVSTIVGVRLGEPQAV